MPKAHGLPRRNIRGQEPHLIRDVVLSMAFKVYSTFSSRRFHCALEDAHERGFLVNPVPGMKVNSFFETAELTPILHKLIG